MSMDDKQYRALGIEAVYLCACAFHGETPQWNEDADLTALFRFCQFHGITAMTAMALECCPEVASNQEQMKPWKQAKDKAIRKNILLNAERQRILQHLESIGCWYMPLKGSLLQHDYPKFGMRQMSDNDILFDPAKQQAVYEFMMASGYRAELYGQGNHDEYIKEPVYNFEMHRSLFSHVQCPELELYYRDVGNKLCKDADNGYGYHLSWEDFYVYLTAHNYKHYIQSGIGLRSLLDVYAFLRAHGDGMDYAYIQTELDRLGCRDYEASCRALSGKLFAKPRRDLELSAEEAELFGVFASGGAHGTKEKSVENSLQKLSQEKQTAPWLTKLRYVWQRLFPSAQTLSYMHPQVLEKPWLVPILWLGRFWKAAFVQPKKVLQEIRMLRKQKNK